jgi:hypothetical protein
MLVLGEFSKELRGEGKKINYSPALDEEKARRVVCYNDYEQLRSEAFGGEALIITSHKKAGCLCNGSWIAKGAQHAYCR